MTGIERLREFVAGIRRFARVCDVTMTAYDMEHVEVGGARLRDFLTDITDQIEREQTDELLCRLVVMQDVVDRMRGFYSDPCSSVSVSGDVVLGWARDIEEAIGRRDVSSYELTHERPDSWEQFERDCDAISEAEGDEASLYAALADYCARRGLLGDDHISLVARDLARRARAFEGRV